VRAAGAMVGVESGRAVHAALEALEGEQAGQDEVVVARFAAPHLSYGHAAHEDRARGLAPPDRGVDAMPARRGLERSGLAADPGERGRRWVLGDRATGLDQREPLPLG